jgi:hypothetical protein
MVRLLAQNPVLFVIVSPLVKQVLFEVRYVRAVIGIQVW